MRGSLEGSNSAEVPLTEQKCSARDESWGHGGTYNEEQERGRLDEWRKELEFEDECIPETIEVPDLPVVGARGRGEVPGIRPSREVYMALGVDRNRGRAEMVAAFTERFDDRGGRPVACGARTDHALRASR